MLGEPMVGLSTGSEGAPELISPASTRPLAEMNGHWNAYSAYNANGSARGGDHSTASFRMAFERIYLIVHGGPSVNARLRALGLPPVAAPTVPAPNAVVVWNPQGHGSPVVPGNSAQAYYPGDRYVDVVADDLYDIGGKAEWAAADALYDAHRGSRSRWANGALGRRRAVVRLGDGVVPRRPTAAPSSPSTTPGARARCSTWRRSRSRSGPTAG
jgi:hypothetical protein